MNTVNTTFNCGIYLSALFPSASDINSTASAEESEASDIDSAATAVKAAATDIDNKATAPAIKASDMKTKADNTLSKRQPQGKNQIICTEMRFLLSKQYSFQPKKK